MGKVEANIDGVKNIKDRLTSRKFWITQQIIVMVVVVPVLFQHMHISESITMVVLGVVGGAGAAYGVVNTLDKKLGN